MDEAQERAALIEAITKLVDDPDFRRSFLTHYRLWLHPPLVVNGDVTTKLIDGQPGAINFITDEEMKKHLAGNLVFAAKPTAHQPNE